MLTALSPRHGIPLLFLGLVCSVEAQAKSSKTFDYRFDSVWATTIRFLRADQGYKITDKDRESGYVLFVYPGSGAIKECTGSLEILNITDEQGTKKIRVQLSIAYQPSYIEVHLLDKLEDKLREELGAPPSASDKKAKESKPGEKPTEPAKPGS